MKPGISRKAQKCNDQNTSQPAYMCYARKGNIAKINLYSCHTLHATCVTIAVILKCFGTLNNFKFLSQFTRLEPRALEPILQAHLLASYLKLTLSQYR